MNDLQVPLKLRRSDGIDIVVRGILEVFGIRNSPWVEQN